MSVFPSDSAKAALAANGIHVNGDSPTGAVKFRMATFAELGCSTMTEYCVKGVLPRRGLVIVWGPPKCGKSFLVFDVVMAPARGVAEYRGRKVQGGTVVYMALEGQAGFGARKEAYCRKHLTNGAALPDFHLCGTPLDLVRDVAKLVADIKAQCPTPRIVVLDTLNRSLTGSESKDQDMAAYIQAADAVRDAFDCLVIIIHHCGHDGSRPRGHSSLLGAADVQIAVAKDDSGNVIATVEYAKDMAEGATFASRLEVVDLGIDQDGDAVTSCVVVPVEAGEIAAGAGKRLSGDARTFREAFVEALDRHGKMMPVREGEAMAPMVKAVEIEWVREEFYRRHTTGEADEKKRAAANRQAFNRQRKSADYGSATQAGTEWIWKL